jgi:hypothetical protein
VDIIFTHSSVFFTRTVSIAASLMGFAPGAVGGKQRHRFLSSFRPQNDHHDVGPAGIGTH